MHNLSKRHADIESVAVDVWSSRDAYACCAVVEKLWLGGVAECHTDEEVLVAPGVVVIATGIETCCDVRYIWINPNRARIGGIETRPVFLLPKSASSKVKLCVRRALVATGRRSTGSTIVAVREERLSFGIAAVSKLIANFVNGVVRVVDLSVGVGAIVCMAGITGDNLHILITIVAFLLSETDSGIYLVTYTFQVAGSGACAVDKAAGAHLGWLICIVVAVVDKHIAAKRAAGFHPT